MGLKREEFQLSAELAELYVRHWPRPAAKMYRRYSGAAHFANNK